MTKRTSLLPLTEETLEQNARGWLTGFKYRESGTVIQIQADCEFYIPLVINNSTYLKSLLGPYYKKYIFGYLRLDNKPLIESLKILLWSKLQERNLLMPNREYSLEELLKIGEEKGFELCIFISHASHLFRQESYSELFELEHYLRLNPVFSVLLFSEIDITDESFSVLMDKCSSLFTNIMFYPFYGKNDTRQFIEYNARLWSMKISEAMMLHLITECGGQLWFTRQALRFIRNNPLASVDEALKNELMLRKINVFFDKFSLSEKAIIKKVALGTIAEEDKNTRAYQFLKKIRVIEENGISVSLLVPIFRYILDKGPEHIGFSLKNGALFYNDLDISDRFNRQEGLLMRYLIANRDRVIKREEISKVLWGDDLNQIHSEWAIDQSLHRLRTRLNTFGYGKNVLKTIKKVGIKFETN